MIKNKNEIDTQMQDRQREYDVSLERALENTDAPIETRRKYKDIMLEVKRIELVIEQNQSMTIEENQNKIIAEYRELCATVGRLVSDMAKLMDYINLLSKSIEDRKVAFQHLRFYITRVVNYFFTQVLKQKEFTGCITPYYQDTTDEDGKVKKAKTLEVVIYPRDKNQFSNNDTQAEPNSMYSSTKSLSGGERSFSTVAFIISLLQILP